jgi:signal peptidase I
VHERVTERPVDGSVDEPRPRRAKSPTARLTRLLPRPLRVAIDWVVTIVGAIALVLLVKSYVVNPYQIPTASMEPTLHCGKPQPNCLAQFSDRVLANRVVYHLRNPRRAEIIVFEAPPQAARRCPPGGTFVKRIIGLPGDTVVERAGIVSIERDGRRFRLDEPYVSQSLRGSRSGRWGPIPEGHYFVMGDHRVESCDSRVWGAVSRERIVGPVVAVYWPPGRIGLP